ncbi:hypothetical protein SEMRO_583_G170680.1 [Seminavis robusta]|uniref:Uncharacterized protein n=1 Tax=Seminavis robusta TaxID=568900 RepID=A0A9N8HHU1_9STRA|nr:hypothetical protein SEMRO_583_G170680.1 [Seminavis robusta]|eukprot:Sro583_g170680.1 n/a (1056) ;mRNA; f:40245-43412
MGKRRSKNSAADAETPSKSAAPLADQTNAFSPVFASPPPKRGLLSLTTPNFKKGGLFKSPAKEVQAPTLSVGSQTISLNKKSVAIQTDPLPCLSFENEVIARDPSQQLQQQTFDTLSALHLQQKNKDYVRLSARHGQQTYFKIPNSRIRASKDPSRQSCKKLSRQSTLISGLFQRLFGASMQQILPAILTSIGKQFRLAVLPIDASGLTIVQAVALRDHVPTSTRGLERLANALYDCSPFLGKLLFPKQLRRRISEFEKCTLDVELSFEVVPLEMNGDGKMKPCIHAWVSNPPIVLEGLTRSALVAGKFQQSETVSSHKGEILVVQGCDKGGNVTLSLMRVANRMDGNAPQFCFPLAFYEDGRESYANLAKTIYDDSKTVQPFIQALLDGKFHMITASASQGTDVIDAQCLLVQFSGYSVYEKSRAFIQDTCGRVLPDADHRELLAHVDEAKSRSQPATVSLDRVRANCSLAIRLVRSDPAKTEGDDSSLGASYAGILLYETTQTQQRTLVARLQFTSTLSVSSNAEVMLRCYGCRPFTADDLKLNIAVSGQGTAASKYPCPICVASKDQLSLCVHNLAAIPPLRVGEHHNRNLHARFLEVAGGRAMKVATDSSAASMEIKDLAKSVVNRPLLLTPPPQNTAGSMHVCQGLMTHLTRRTFQLLEKIDRRSLWYSELKNAVQDASNTTEIKEMVKEMHQRDRAIYKQLQNATKWPNVPSQVERAGILLAEREQHSVQTGMEAWSKVQTAGTELSSAGNKFIKDSGSKPEGVASYLLYQSFCVDGGVRFNVEHSGLELTNANGIKVLSNYETIANRVEQAYSEGNETHLREDVKAVMAMWRQLAGLLLELSAILKRQSKLTTEEIERLKQCANEYGRQWMAMIPGKDTVFNKLHTLIAHLTTFAETHGTIGLVNEESFEATHPRAQTISSHLRSMVSTEAKVQKTVQRFSLGLNTEYETTRTALQDGRKTGRRNLRNGDTYARRTRKHDVAPIRNQTQDGQLPPELVYVDTNRAVVKKEWLDYYNYLVCGRVPASWRKAFGDDDEIGNVFKVKSEYV